VQKIESWANDSSGPPIYWLNQSSSAENNKIARVIAHRMDADHRLGASFFCSQAATRGEAHLIFTTLCRQLAVYSPDFLGHLKKKNVLQSGDTSQWNVGVQFNDLILEPSSATKISAVVIIDALERSGVTGSLAFSPLFSVLEEKFPKNKICVKFLMTAAPQENANLRRGFRSLAQSGLAVIYEPNPVHVRTGGTSH
jgi:hypothetical protein